MKKRYSIYLWWPTVNQADFPEVTWKEVRNSKGLEHGFIELTPQELGEFVVRHQEQNYGIMLKGDMIAIDTRMFQTR